MGGFHHDDIAKFQTFKDDETRRLTSEFYDHEEIQGDHEVWYLAHTGGCADLEGVDVVLYIVSSFKKIQKSNV